MKKLYCYVDETGQDTKGLVFLVCCSVVLTIEKKENLEKTLLAIEKRIKKRNKWHKTKWQIKIAYLKEILRIDELKGNIYIKKFSNTMKYFDKTLEAVTNTLKLNKYRDNKAIVIIDGLPRQLEPKAATSLRHRGVKVEKVRGTKDEVTALVRLSDAIAGLTYGYIKEKDYAKKYYPLLLKRNIVKEIE